MEPDDDSMEVAERHAGVDDRDMSKNADRINAVRLVLVMVAVMWGLEIFDVLTGHALDQLGIVPRALYGLLGVVIAPFLHFGFAHLASNTIPFVVLGLIIAVGGTLRVVTVTVVTALASGLGVWLLSPSSSVTVGASGLVFGFAAYVITRGIVERHLAYIGLGLVMLPVWGAGLLMGLLPQAGISWQGHLFGAVGGVLAARLLHAREPGTTVPAPEPQ
jgi:membrane associated rhomboid family serine protease